MFTRVPGRVHLEVNASRRDSREHLCCHKNVAETSMFRADRTHFKDRPIPKDINSFINKAVSYTPSGVLEVLRQALNRIWSGPQ